jgi:hypothetical protein
MLHEMWLYSYGRSASPVAMVTVTSAALHDMLADASEPPSPAATAAGSSWRWLQESTMARGMQTESMP